MHPSSNTCASGYAAYYVLTTLVLAYSAHLHAAHVLQTLDTEYADAHSTPLATLETVLRRACITVCVRLRRLRRTWAYLSIHHALSTFPSPLVRIPLVPMTDNPTVIAEQSLELERGMPFPVKRLTFWGELGTRCATHVVVATKT